MTRLQTWLHERPRRLALALWLACAALAALFLAPSIRAGGFGPGDLLLGMTPWNLYRDQFPEVRGVHNPQLDVIQQYFPWRLLAAHWLRQGVVPLWNPHEYCGQPFVANVLSAVFYPFTWLALALPIGTFFLVSAWTHLTLLGGGMASLLRSHGLRGRSALAGAAVMMLNGFVVGWLAFPNVSQWTYAWLPLLILAWRGAWLAKRPARLAGVALCLGLAVLGGHLQIALYVGLAWLVYATAWVLLDRQPRALGLYVLLPATVGGALAALQVLPAVELAAASGRSMSWEALAGAAFPPAQAITLLVPWFFGHNALDVIGAGGGGHAYSYWGPYNNAIEASVSTGTAAVLLAVVALVYRRGPNGRPDRAVVLYACLALLGALLATRTPVAWLFWRFAPGGQSLTGLARAFCLWTFGVAALAGFGVEALSGPFPGAPCRRRTAAVLLTGLVLALLLAYAAEAQRTTGAESRTAFNAVLAPFVAKQAGWALLAALAVLVPLWRWPGAGAPRRLAPLAALAPAVELFLLGFGLHRGFDPDLYFFTTPEIEYLASRPEPSRFVGVPGGGRVPDFLDWMPMNTPVAYGVSSPSGSESLSLSGYRELSAQFTEPGWQVRLDSPLLDLVGVRHVLSRAELHGRHGLRRVAGERCGVYENPEALPLAFAALSWRTGTREQALAALGRPDLDPRLPILAADAPVSMVTTASLAPCYVRQLTPQRWLVRSTAGGVRAITLTTPRAPGWRVWVNDAPARLWSADAVFMAVIVGPGEARVRFVYSPASYRLGLFLTLLAAAMLSTAWVSRRAGRARWRRREGSGSERADSGPAHPRTAASA